MLPRLYFKIQSYQVESPLNWLFANQGVQDVADPFKSLIYYNMEVF